MSSTVEVEAAFEIELVSNAGIKALVERFGRDPVQLAWGLGWVNGKQAGLQQAREILG